MKMTIRRLVAVTVTSAALIAPGIAMASSADAATYTCNDATSTSTSVKYKPIYQHGSTQTTTCYMTVGADNSAVVALQTALVKCYGRNIAIDGSYGSATKSALAYAQGKAHVTADGLYGPATAAAIKFATHDNVGRAVC